MTASSECADQAYAGPPQPETLAKLLRQLGVRNASALQDADALRAKIHRRECDRPSSPEYSGDVAVGVIFLPLAGHPDRRQPR